MITRYRGDTQRVRIDITKNAAKANLNDITKVEVGIDKKTEIILIECIKDADVTSGIVYVPFSITDLDTVGTFNFDVQVTWTDTTKTTLLVDKFKVLDDINKT